MLLCVVRRLPKPMHVTIAQVAVRTRLCSILYLFGTFSHIVFMFAGDLVCVMVAVRSRMVAVRSDGVLCNVPVFVRQTF